MKRVMMGGACALLLAACETDIPDSGAGVGFGDYDTYAQQQAARDAELEGRQTVPGASEVTTLPLPAEGAPQTTAVATAQPGAVPAQSVTGAAGISRENDFDAVSGQRTIQDDAALIAQNRAQYTLVQPTDLPQRSGNEGPNIVAYALQTDNPVGVQLYRRSGFNAANRAQRNCAKYVTDDQAQTDFLVRGGPERDRLGLDPDGDGYACQWDPRPFRLARQATPAPAIPAEEP